MQENEGVQSSNEDLEDDDDDDDSKVDTSVIDKLILGLETTATFKDQDAHDETMQLLADLKFDLGTAGYMPTGIVKDDKTISDLAAEYGEFITENYIDEDEDEDEDSEEDDVKDDEEEDDEDELEKEDLSGEGDDDDEDEEDSDSDDDLEDDDEDESEDDPDDDDEDEDGDPEVSE